MNRFNQEDFIRLQKDKVFAREVLLYKSDDLLRGAFDLLTNEPERMNEIIEIIIESIDKHLNSKDKFKVVHSISKGQRSLRVIGLKNLYTSKSSKINEFNKGLDDALQMVEYREEVRIKEREVLLKEFRQKEVIVKPNNTPIGFHSTLQDDKIDLLYNNFKGIYIDNNTNLNDFRAIFKSKPLPRHFKKVKWIHLNKKKSPNQTSLREFLKTTMNFDTIEPDNNSINNCFTDSKGERLRIGKNKVSDYTDVWTKKFRTMINHL